MFTAIKQLFYKPVNPFDTLTTQVRKNLATNIFDVEHFRMMSHDKLVAFFAYKNTEDVDPVKVEEKRIDIIENATEEIEQNLDQLSTIGAIQYFGRTDLLEEYACEVIAKGREYAERQRQLIKESHEETDVEERDA